MQKLSEQEQQKRMQVAQLANMLLPACVQSVAERLLHAKEADAGILAKDAVAMSFIVAKAFFLEIHEYMGEPEIYKAPAGMN